MTSGFAVVAPWPPPGPKQVAGFAAVQKYVSTSGFCPPPSPVLQLSENVTLSAAGTVTLKIMQGPDDPPPPPSPQSAKLAALLFASPKTMKALSPAVAGMNCPMS